LVYSKKNNFLYISKRDSYGKTRIKWVKQTRQILLDQCRELNEDDFTKEFEFGFQSIRDSLVHVAGCYHAWLGSFVLSETSSPLFTKEVINNM
jgi:uncharacterized damage-inducible protein DinB